MEFYEAGGGAIAELLVELPGAGATGHPPGQLFVNQAPAVNAGADQAITLPSAASLSGSASDDGLPNPPAALTTTWSKVSGPGTVAFANASALSTTATFSAAGTYVLRLTATDGTLSSSDTITIVVTGAGGGTGDGLSATYYDNINFTGTTVSRIDPTVNFNWGAGSPAAGIGIDTFSVRWTGEVLAPNTGTLHLLHPQRRRRPPVGQRPADHQQLDRSRDDREQRDDCAHRRSALHHHDGVLRGRWGRGGNAVVERPVDAQGNHPAEPALLAVECRLQRGGGRHAQAACYPERERGTHCRAANFPTRRRPRIGTGRSHRCVLSLFQIAAPAWAPSLLTA